MKIKMKNPSKVIKLATLIIIAICFSSACKEEYEPRPPKFPYIIVGTCWVDNTHTPSQKLCFTTNTICSMEGKFESTYNFKTINIHRVNIQINDISTQTGKGYYKGYMQKAGLDFYMRLELFDALTDVEIKGQHLILYMVR